MHLNAWHVTSTAGFDAKCTVFHIINSVAKVAAILFAHAHANKTMQALGLLLTVKLLKQMYAFAK